MKKLRTVAKNEISKILGSADFSVYNFSINFETDEETIVHIVFNLNPSFSFKICEKFDTWSTYECPSENFLEEERYIGLKNYDAAISRLKAWINRLIQELRISVINFSEELERLREEINKNIDESIPDGDDLLSDKEKEEWALKIENLYESIENLKTDQEITKNQLRQIRIEFDRTKEIMDFYPKKTWYKIFGQKFISIFMRIKDSSTVKELAKESAKTLLIEGIKKTL